MNDIASTLAELPFHWKLLLFPVGACGVAWGYFCLRQQKRSPVSRAYPPAGKPVDHRPDDTLVDEPDLWSYTPGKVLEPPPLPEAAAESAQPAFKPREDGFLSHLWEEARSKPDFSQEPFWYLSQALNRQTSALYRTLTSKESWRPADKVCLRHLVERVQSNQTPEHASCRYFTCPPEDADPENLAIHDSWTLVKGLLGLEGQSRPVVPHVAVDARLGRMIFAVMELGLARMQPQKNPLPPNRISLPGESEIRRQEIDAWLAVRRQSMNTLAAFQQAASEKEAPLNRKVLFELQQDAEALWEMNRRGGNTLKVYTDEIRRIYTITDKAVLRTLSITLGVPMDELRFSPYRDPLKRTGQEFGRIVTYQVKAKPGELVPRPAPGTASSMMLHTVSPMETAWRDLPASMVKPIYEHAFYCASEAAKHLGEMDPADFAESMGQVFGDRLPIEHARGKS